MNSEKKVGPETTALCELLGRLDCLFWPRFPNDRRNVTTCWEWRQSWLSGVGLPIRTSNSNEIERKSAEQLWKTLERSDLVTVTRKKGRRSHVRFTATGEAFTRRICATGSIFAYREELEAFAALCDEVGENNLPASLVAGLEPWENTPEGGEALYMKTCYFVPHATAGHVSFTLDTCRRLWIGLTEAGREAMTNPPEEPQGADDWHLTEEASDVYETSFTAARQELAVAKPAHPNNFIVPRVPTGWGDFRGYLELVRKIERDREERQRQEEVAS